MVNYHSLVLIDLLNKLLISINTNYSSWLLINHKIDLNFIDYVLTVRFEKVDGLIRPICLNEFIQHLNSIFSLIDRPIQFDHKPNTHQILGFHPGWVSPQGRVMHCNRTEERRFTKLVTFVRNFVNVWGKSVSPCSSRLKNVINFFSVFPHGPASWASCVAVIPFTCECTPLVTCPWAVAHDGPWKCSNWASNNTQMIYQAQG
jgi:hypothetical protein